MRIKVTDAEISNVKEININVIQILNTYLDLEFYCYLYGFEMCLKIDLVVFDVFL